MALCQVEHIPGHEPSAKYAGFCALPTLGHGTPWHKHRRTRQCDWKGLSARGSSLSPQWAGAGEQAQRYVEIRGWLRERRSDGLDLGAESAEGPAAAIAPFSSATAASALATS
jgi:hypothetical protein